VRRWCIQVTSHVHFDRFITSCIVLNSVILAIEDFSVVDNKLNPSSHGKRFVSGKLVDAYSAVNHAVEVFEIFTTIVFTAKFLLKVVALGVVGKGSYWKDPWNVTDFLMLFARYNSCSFLLIYACANAVLTPFLAALLRRSQACQISPSCELFESCGHCDRCRLFPVYDASFPLF